MKEKESHYKDESAIRSKKEEEQEKEEEKGRRKKIRGRNGAEK